MNHWLSKEPFNKATFQVNERCDPFLREATDHFDIIDPFSPHCPNTVRKRCVRTSGLRLRLVHLSLLSLAKQQLVFVLDDCRAAASLALREATTTSCKNQPHQPPVNGLQRCTFPGDSDSVTDSKLKKCSKPKKLNTVRELVGRCFCGFTSETDPVHVWRCSWCQL